MDKWRRELWWLQRDRAALLALAIAVILSVLAVVLGTHRVGQQAHELAALQREDAAERYAAIEAHGEDPGSEAYYSFHLTYAPPPALAFAALGTRDTHPWRHRVRMLALEGQIYETDLGNPELVDAGTLDFAFVASILLPLLVIALLHDLVARERRDGRLEWLLATAEEGWGLLRRRAILRMGLLWGALGVPLLGGALVNGADPLGTLGMLALLAAHLAFWALIAWCMSQRLRTAATVATVLVGLWALLTLSIPPFGALLADRLSPAPSGGELLLAQREKVNDAWDLPKETTMTPFLEQHPQWTAYAEVERPFEWKWYYAFQQVGDQSVQAQSLALREAFATRDRVMGTLALLSPPLLVQRSLENLAGTNASAYLRYESCVRDFHAQLREHYYPALFAAQAYGPRLSSSHANERALRSIG